MVNPTRKKGAGIDFVLPGSRPASGGGVAGSAVSLAEAPAVATPAPMRAHWPEAPSPEAAPNTSSAIASPARMMGIAISVAFSGCRR